MSVTVEWKVSTTASNATLGAWAWVSGAAVGTELVNTAEPTSDTTQSFSVSGLSRAQLVNGVFGVRVRATRGNNNTAFTASLDAVSVRVDYTAASVTSITVNAVGATTARGSDSFTYDQANRLRTATVSGTTETYTYDGDGVRFSRQVGAGPLTRYVSDVNTSLPVTIDDGARKYVWGEGLAYAASGSTLEVYHTDRLGSVRAITDAAGTVTATTGSSSQPFAFTGEPRDATGLLYLRARYYDPSWGRFLSRDPLVGNPWSCQTLNRFAYVGNNPATYADPSGLKARVLEPQTGFCLGGVVAGSVGLVTLGIVDTGIAAANVLALGFPIAEVALIPVDVGAVAATWAMYSIVEQGTRMNCDEITWKWPWE